MNTEEKKPIKMYFKGGEGLTNPIDYNGKEIKEGDFLTTDGHGEEGVSFYKTYYPAMTDKDIYERMHSPLYIVKRNENGIFYGDGLKQKLYLHDFRFKHCKVISQLREEGKEKGKV